MLYLKLAKLFISGLLIAIISTLVVLSIAENKPVMASVTTMLTVWLNVYALVVILKEADSRIAMGAFIIGNGVGVYVTLLL